MTVHQPRRARSRSTALLALLVLGASVAHATIPASERTALQDLYTSTNGATWSTKTNWNGAVGTECTWYGVVCDVGHATVTGIDLHGNGLFGSLPADFNNLTNITYFLAGANFLSGSIPSLAGLSALQFFDVHSNQLTGPIPSLTGLTSLEGLNVAFNQLTGPIPALTDPVNLTSLFLNNNQLTGPIPAVASLTKLVNFWVSTNQLTGSMPSLTGLTSLVNFYVFGNKLTGPFPALTGLSSLAYVAASDNQFTGSLPALTGLALLDHFQVDHNQFTGNVPSVPVPDALVPGGSILCPNPLSHTADPAWDAATGQTPWYTNCGTAAVFQGAQSRKVHATAGTFDLPIAP